MSAALTEESLLEPFESIHCGCRSGKQDLPGICGYLSAQVIQGPTCLACEDGRVPVQSDMETFVSIQKIEQEHPSGVVVADVSSHGLSMPEELLDT